MSSEAISLKDAKDLVKKLDSLLSSKEASAEDKQIRGQATQLAHRLWLELEEPGDIIDRIVFQTQENAILRLGLDLGIYELLVNRNDAVTVDEVSKEVKADKQLMERVFRNLAAMGHVDEAGNGAYKANKVTRAFTTPKGVHLASFSHEFATPAWTQIPDFLKANGYRNPVDPMDAPVQRAFNSKKHFFDLMVQQNVFEMFQKAMTSYRTGRADFLDIFPADKQLIEGFDGGDVLLVDVGGGHGHEIAKFREKFADAPGRMILQEQQGVLDQTEKTDRMEYMVHDFFTAQPVKGARCYNFRMIFHDWPNDKSIEILKATASAMKPGYSKITINDIVLPDQGASRFATVSDINMLALLAAVERSETQWQRLLDEAGLEIVKIWPGVPESVIEATLKG